MLLTTNDEFEGEATRLQWGPVAEGLRVASRSFDEPEGAYPTWGLHRLRIDVVPREASGDAD